MNTITTLLRIIAGTAFSGILLLSCSRKIDDYKKFQDNKEVVYSGTVANLTTRPGNLRIKVSWNPSPDPSITGYILYWNNGRDSLVLPATTNKTSDTVSTVISTHLQESDVQSFLLYTYDAAGNRSVGQRTQLTRMYGPIYESSLYNKQLLTNTTPFRIFGNDSVRLYFTKSDSTNIYSKVYYYKQDNTLDSITVSKDSVTLENYKLGTKAAIQSYFLPGLTAIDTFRTRKPDSTILIQFTPYTDTALAYSYRATGTRYNYNSDGSAAGTTAIDIDKQIEKTDYISVRTDDVANLANNGDTRMILTFAADGTIDVSGYIGVTNPIENHPTAGRSYIDRATGDLVMRYKYTNSDGSFRLIEEVWKRK
ncbi:DUF4998 domain-containing protein [Niabella beijingensis]|uniref:DUF4998 domain-containing protein n=1 Tax=Niabella beijingensis TaxID=2872700 RepID=UPI001CC06961|nr:DUF4998 domain-containing protein [Niabella beijingensis]MBZ4187375.1 DUF4998 domain-containing protein [Niabella beijingensis]